MTGASHSLDDAKTQVAHAVDRLADDLERISHLIHANPGARLQGREGRGLAHRVPGAARGTGRARGRRVADGLPGDHSRPGPGLTIAIMAEYDALPNIGHACGHNIIATAGVGAGAALAAALEDASLHGRVQVIGTPAEEGGAGKVKLMEAGVFEDVDAAMMIHGRCGTQVWRPSLGIVKVRCEFFGKAAHASSWPWRGVNALNAMIQLFVSLDQMRQQVRPEARIHGVIIKGGEQANIIPEYTRPSSTCARPPRSTARSCCAASRAAAEGAATATGCRVTVTADPIIHDPLKPNFAMAALFEKNLERIDFPVDPDDGEAGYASTDCGNVSQALPTIHPYIRISPDGIPGHSREFAEWARSPLARTGMVAAAKALAMTALDLVARPAELDRAKKEFAATAG